jgi:methyl-accepting chemotaxis protein
MASHLTGRSMQAATSMRTASSGVTSAAAAAEELAATTGDIASSGRRSHALADEAVTRVDETVGRIRHLSEAAGHIERVVQIIRTIADHTNLLALNATIEAARAGEAGRGFSVVAAEVKALATQTARATDEITQSVSGILDATQGAVASVEVAKGAITGLVDLATAVASAVSDQERAVEMIARDIAAASATTDVTAGVIDDVAGTAGETASQGKLVLESGLSLRTRIDALERDARSFFERVRAA